MSNNLPPDHKPCGSSDCACDAGKPKRKRSLTSVTLEWLAEKMRVKERLRSEIQSGTYKVPSSDIAKALINEE